MVQIANTDLELFPLNLGGNTFGWTSDESESFAVLDRFVADGGNFIDTADMYSVWVDGHVGGESEAIIGSWLASRGMGGQVAIATKVARHAQFPGLASGNVRDACDASLDRLGVDQIDLYYAHFDDDTQTIPDIATVFSELQDAGKIGAIGVSNFAPDRIVEWLEFAAAEGLHAPVALQPNYSLVARKYERELAPIVERFGLQVFTYFSLAAGFLTGKYRSAADADSSQRGSTVSRFFTDDGFALVDVLRSVSAELGVQPASVAVAWLLAKGVTAPIASARVPEQLDPLFAGVELRLSTAQVKRLDEASAPFVA